MKLLFCLTCCDVVRLWPHEWRTCHCGGAGGQYDGSDACATTTVDYTRRTGVVLGFNNDSLSRAVSEQVKYGDRADGMGREFTAFVIPKGAAALRIITGEEPAQHN